MLGLTPLLSAPLLASSLPEPIPDPFAALAGARGSEFAVILEITGFPKQFPGLTGGAHPLLGNALLSGFGLPGEQVQNPLSTRTLLLSDLAYRTEPSDQLRPNIWTEARMTRRADVEQSAPVSQGASRRAQDTSGDMEFADNDGALRGVSDNFSFEGRAASIHIVGLGRPWIEKTTVSQSVVKRLTRSKHSLRVTFKDAADILDTALITRKYGGSGLRDGTQELKGTSPPGGWGLCKYAKPLLEDPSIFLYRLHDGSIQSVQAVEERGLAFTFAGDEPSYEALRTRASTLAEGEYATCLVDGSIVIKFAGGSPLDRNAIRVTFEGSKGGGTFTQFMGDVMLAMMKFSMGLNDSQIDSQSFQTLPQHKISYYFGGGTQSPTGAQVFTELMNSAFGTFGSVNNERIGAKLFFPPDDQSAAQTFVSAEIFSASEVEPPQEAIWSQTINYGPNQNPYTTEQLASGLTQSQIDERTRSFAGSFTDNKPDIKASNLFAEQPDAIDSVFDEEAGAKDSVQRLMGVWGVFAKSFEVELAFSAAQVTRGSVVSMTHDDLGDKSGGKFLVFNKRLQLSKRRVILTVVG